MKEEFNDSPLNDKINQDNFKHNKDAVEYG
jgi:hypothetical protein